MAKKRESWAGDQKTAAVFCLTLALCALIPLALTSRDRDPDGSASVARQLPLTLQSLQLRLAEADAAHRTWLITARERHLAAYNSNAEQVRELLTTLRSGMEADAVQSARFASLEKLVDRRLSEHSDLSKARKDKGISGVTQALTTDNAEKTTTDARAMASAMMADAQKQLDRTDAHANTTRNKRIFSLVAALNLMILALGFRLVNRYITQRKNVERQLQEATDAAQSANTAKTAFLANMSHEIRTPLTAILGYTDMLVEPAQSNADRGECLSSIRRNARHLLDLLNDVLDISKIEAGRMTAEKIVFDLPTLAAEVASMMRPRAIEKGLAFRLAFEGAVPQKIKSDPVRLKQILVNLVGNAIKFTEKGHVILSVSCTVRPASPDTATTEHVENSAVVRFDVADTGIGLTQMQTERLFEPFTQADESMTRRFGGSGLGLTISRRLALLLGGVITVQSKPLTGSTFTVTIDGGTVDESTMRRGLTESLIDEAPTPLVAAAEERPSSVPSPAAAPEGEAGPLAKVRVLFAEDGKDNQRLISAHLKRAGAMVTLADNGKIALDLVRAQTFDILLMDMQMPELDGYGAARAMRELGILTPIIALTAHAMKDDREKCIVAGCSDYLTKPVDRMNLVRTIASHLADAAPAALKAQQHTAVGLLRSEYADDPDMRPLIHDFVANFPEQVATLQTLLRSQQLEELRRHVHQLKGAGGGYGFPRITDLAARAEQSLKTQQSLDAIVAQVQELTQLLGQIHQHNAAISS
jgi:signal transduction histidine kinase/DNA-binding response OmpR family regulator